MGDGNAAVAVAKLNVNASVFVPRFKIVNNENAPDLKPEVDAVIERKLKQPILVLPWKGFPRPIRPLAAKIADKDQKTVIEQGLKNVQRVAENVVKNELNEPKPISNVEVVDEKRRQVALQALKLVEQRRLREADKKPEPLNHLTREAVNYTPEERKRVDRLRIWKRERIERVLREMQQEKDEELKKESKAEEPKVEAVRLKTKGRYVCLQRAVKPEILKEQQEQKQADQQAEPISVLPKRYIPTAKQWDERRKAKASEASSYANKENFKAKKSYAKLEENVSAARVLVAPSSHSNIMRPSQPPISGAKELFVPRYRPPALLLEPPSLTDQGEQRKGNLIHARNISHVFKSCGLLTTPKPLSWEAELKAKQMDDVEKIPEPEKPIKRYGLEELLKWEPQPNELKKPAFNQDHFKLSFISK